jgi:hypothetical protein
MKILGLDLGTNCGVAHNLSGNELTVFTKTFATDKEVTRWGQERLTRRQDPRIVRFADFLSGLGNPDVVIFEDVEFQTYTKQTQLWSSFRTAVWLTFKHSLLECVPVSTLKKFATGHGGATKPMMEAAMRREHPEIFRQKQAVDDNGVDAAWLWFWAKKHLARYHAPSIPTSN